MQHSYKVRATLIAASHSEDRGMTQSVSSDEPDVHTIVASDKFILATRDTGYRSVAAAVAELVDNALQADAKCIRIDVRDEDTGGGRTVTLGVLDDGHGMARDTLRAALQFGGSNRFDERTGLGRFGMGLPNSSVSQTRRFEVYSWQSTGPVLASYLDVDEVASGRLRSIPAPVERELPQWARACAAPSGTLVLWSRCDRLGRLRATTIAQRLCQALGRVYRFALWDGITITVNDTRLVPVDPLFLDSRSSIHGAAPFGTPLTYEFAAPLGGSAFIEVRFSELPVATWHEWSTEEKRRHGVVGRAGVSIVRAGREIDYGWYLLGAKRRENYDDWWRCEIRFPPPLDELFGVTHSKQGITPSHELRAAIEGDLEEIARTLNSRTRSAFEEAKQKRKSDASRSASDVDQFLPVPPRTRRRISGTGFRYSIRPSALATPDFYRVDLVRDTVTVTLNREHPFYTKVYLPICENESRERYNIECMLLAAARAELEATTPDQRQFLTRLRRSWADALVAFLEP